MIQYGKIHTLISPCIHMYSTYTNTIHTAGKTQKGYAQRRRDLHDRERLNWGRGRGGGFHTSGEQVENFEPDKYGYRLHTIARSTGGGEHGEDK